MNYKTWSSEIESLKSKARDITNPFSRIDPHMTYRNLWIVYPFFIVNFEYKIISDNCACVLRDLQRNFF